ncbi:OmpA family protein [Sphingorhabdus contaminans]|uniref:OmpA family protein n=1 Tax=Sphingorhabdus contaminans TaxID=1343899 RepID=A0A553WCJ2_9SPHN|nr:OmpA family protein [Sphingorhabdus contaminans]TSB02418.1 OmpA family protein [Sphingorhabdus contaminans]
MNVISNRTGFPVLLAVATVAFSGMSSAQSNDPTIVVDGVVAQETAVMAKGPDIKGIITARSGDKLKITTADGNATIVSINEATKIKSGGGLLSSKNKLTSSALLNGLPVTIKTWQSSAGLIANQITFRNNDLKTATMIRNGTAQQFEEQTAATEALRGRMGDIDKYNIKGTTNVYFDTGKYNLSPRAKEELCATAASAEATDNALMLVVGYTDSVGDEEYNQILSEKRASSVINYLQQACRWKPYRMLTPTGMAESDPLASNDTEEGKAQNRRVSVNILVSKGLDGL